ncbi:MAG: hypothetical protein ICV59_09535 [Thermoleophilia bacterium]|nr:hypothetical protein [Thermoleophilia bacterium]
MRTRTHEPTSVWVLIALAGGGLVAAVVSQAGEIVRTFQDRPFAMVAIIGATVLLQLFAVDLGSGRGAIGFASAGLVVAAVGLSAGTALLAGVAVALVQLLRARGFVHRAVFDAASHALPAAAAAAVYLAVSGSPPALAGELLAGVLAAGVFVVLNNGGLCLAMALSRRSRIVDVWSERFGWATPFYVAFLPVAACLAAIFAAAPAIGVASLVATPLALRVGLSRRAPQPAFPS